MAATDTVHVILSGTKAALAAAAEIDPEPISKVVLLAASDAVDLIEELTKGDDPAKALADLKAALASSRSVRDDDAEDLAARKAKP